MSAPRVTVIAVDGISPFHLSVPSLVWGGETPVGEIDPWPIRVAALRAGTLRTSADFDIDVRHGLEAVRGADVVVVPWWGEPDRAASDELSNALRDAHDEGAELVGLCLGAFPLADSGVLEGRTATTHWKWADVFRHRFPRVALEPDELYIDEGQIVTGAGATAGIDACLHLLARREGQLVANRVARRIVAPPHRSGGQAQFIERPVSTREEPRSPRRCDGVPRTSMPICPSTSSPLEPISAGVRSPGHFGRRRGRRWRSGCSRSGWRRLGSCSRPRRSRSTRSHRRPGSAGPRSSASTSVVHSVRLRASIGRRSEPPEWMHAAPRRQGADHPPPAPAGRCRCRGRCHTETDSSDASLRARGFVIQIAVTIAPTRARIAAPRKAAEYPRVRSAAVGAVPEMP